MPRSLQSLLHAAGPDVSDLIGRARFLERMRVALLAILPREAADHVRVAAYDNYRLRLHVTHGGWATRLRYMQPAIAQALARSMRLHIEQVQIKVRPPLDTPSPTRAPREISAASREHIRRTAHYVEDSELARALERLAQAGRSEEPR